MKTQQEVPHGGAEGIHFWNPDGARIEVDYRVPIEVRQPFRKDPDHDRSVDEVLADSERQLAQCGAGDTGGVGGGRTEEVA